MTADPIVPGFMLVQGNRTEDLRQLLVQWLRRYPLAPLENEVMLVQSNGIAQWLKLALAANPAGEAGGCGIAAALQVMLPARLQWQAYRALLGELPEQSPFDKDALAWRLMRVLPTLLPAAALAPLARFLQNDGDLRKRYQLAQKLADLFDQYQVYRADWLVDWANGLDQLRKPDGSLEPVPAEQAWQPLLWRAILADMPAADCDSSRAAVHARFLQKAAQLDAGRRPAGLPRRVVVFGITSLPQQVLDVLAALARCSQVLLCVNNPCRHYWGDIVDGRELFRDRYRRTSAPEKLLEASDAELHRHGHPLLAAWGKQGRDYLRLLDAHDQRQQYEPLFAGNSLAVDLFDERPATTLLQQLQDDVLALRSLAERQALPVTVADDDASIVFHVAHSPQREVEILHDQLLAVFNSDPSLQPRDVMVMVPDINSYAPHIQAVFGQLERNDPRYIPFTLADQGQRQQKPLLLALDALLRLDHSRFAVSDVLDWLDVPALRARFGIADTQLTLLQRWVRGAQIRWGLHAAQRQQLGLPAGLEQNSWRFGLRRMLLGYAVGSGEAWQGIEPYDEIGGLDAVLAGQLVDLLDRLEVCWQTLQQPAAPAIWGERLRQLLAELFLPQSDEDHYLLDQLEQQLDHWLLLCEAAQFEEALPLSVVREHWLNALEAPQLSHRFLGGAVNFATLLPMRAIPFRRICLLGMNDGDFPRRQPSADFDLMAKVNHYRPGDRSRREDDRYLFLEALLSAREQLYVSWVGRSIRDNSERPPSVLVAQLRDHLEAGWPQCGLTITHPLQPFSREYFPQPADNRWFTYAREWRAVYETATAGECDGALSPWQPEAPVTLQALGDFLRYPVETFFRQRLHVSVPQDAVAGDDCESFSPDGLQRWAWQAALLQPVSRQLVTGKCANEETLLAALDSELAKLTRSGCLPLPPFGELHGRGLLEPLVEQLQRYRAMLEAWSIEAAPVPVVLETAGILLQDWLTGLRTADNGRRVAFWLVNGRLHSGRDYKWYQLVRYWPRHLAAQLDGVPTETLLVSQSGDISLPAVDPGTARTLLGQLLQAYADGLRQPLPIACKTAFAWLAAEDHRREEAARLRYEGGYSRYGEDRGECGESLLLARQWPDFASLLAEPHFVDTMERLYRPLYDCLHATAAPAVEVTV